MKIKLLHLGLSKCGSTFLQKEIFPEVAKKTNISFIDTNKFLNPQKKNFHDLEDDYDFEKKLPNSFIISNEEWFSKKWEFSRLEKSFNYIKRNFSKDTIILFVLRNPYDLLNSIYAQSIHEMIIKKPDKFFYIEKNETLRKDGKYNLYNFDYNYLIYLYKTYFDKVICVKYENLSEFLYLKEVFFLDNHFINFLKSKKNKVINKSISQKGINTILFLNRIFNVKKTQDFIDKCIKPSNNLLYKIRNNILKQFSLKRFFQKKFDKIISYKRFQISKKYIPIDIDKLNRDYYETNF